MRSLDQLTGGQFVRFGLEFEGLVDEKKGRATIARILCDKLQELGQKDCELQEKQVEISAQSVDPSADESEKVRIQKGPRPAFFLGSKSHPRELQWLVYPDSSIVLNKGFVDIEIISPILASDADTQVAREIWAVAQASGVLEHPRFCGVHIHLEWQNADPNELLTARALFGCLEKELLDLLGVLPGRLKWVGDGTSESRLAGAVRQAYSKARHQQDPHEWAQLLGQVRDPRDEKFNSRKSLLRYTDRGTLEFRGLNSTLDFEAVLEVRNLLLHLFFFVQSHWVDILENLESQWCAGWKLSEVLAKAQYPWEEGQKILARLRTT